MSVCGALMFQSVMSRASPVASKSRLDATKLTLEPNKPLLASLRLWYTSAVTGLFSVTAASLATTCDDSMRANSVWSTAADVSDSR